jgi:hypothetical protein
VHACHLGDCADCTHRLRQRAIHAREIRPGTGSRRQAKAQKAATHRFETCMDSTLSSFGPFSFGTQEARLKAAEICKDVMKQ